MAKALSRERATGTVELMQVARLPVGVKEWKIEVWEREPEQRLGTFHGVSIEGHFEAERFEPEALSGVPKDGEGFRCTCKVGAPGLTGEVPLKGHQDWANESWDIFIKVYGDGTQVSADISRRRLVKSRMHGEVDEVVVTDDLPYRFVVRPDLELGFFLYRVEHNEHSDVINRIADLLWLVQVEGTWTGHKAPVSLGGGQATTNIYSGQQDELRSFLIPRWFLDKAGKVKGRGRLFVVVGYGTGARDNWLIELSAPDRFHSRRKDAEKDEEWMGFEWEEWADLSSLVRKDR